MAQRAYANPDVNQSPATPFDMGSGFVNATAALDPGLIFDTSYNDYISFLCGINGSAPVLLNYSGESCGVSTMNGTDLNMPSITISKLNQSRIVRRTLTNIAGNETYAGVQLMGFLLRLPQSVFCFKRTAAGLECIVQFYHE